MDYLSIWFWMEPISKPSLFFRWFSNRGISCGWPLRCHCPKLTDATDDDEGACVGSRTNLWRHRNWGRAGSQAKHGQKEGSYHENSSGDLQWNLVMQWIMMQLCLVKNTLKKFTQKILAHVCSQKIVTLILMQKGGDTIKSSICLWIRTQCSSKLM